jgi:hypothetical protein
VENEGQDTAALETRRCDAPPERKDDAQAV